MSALVFALSPDGLDVVPLMVETGSNIACLKPWEKSVDSLMTLSVPNIKKLLPSSVKLPSKILRKTSVKW